VTTLRIPRIPRGLLVLAIFAGPFIGIATHRLADSVERDRAQAHLERRAASAVFAIESELAADLEVLYALRPLFETGAPVPRERFTAMARPILARHPSLQALEWIPRIAHGSRRAHEQSEREDGLDGYTITERSVTGELAVAGERDWYHPVAFVVPIEGNERALGFDLGSDRLRRKAMDRAAATGEISLTDPITLVQGTASANGVLAFLAVFDGASEITEARGEHLRGFVLAVFRLDQLLQQAHLGPGRAVRTSIQFELIDDEVGDGSLLVPESPVGTQEQSLPRMSAEQPIEVGGQRWRLVALPTAGYLSSMRTRQPLLLGAIAIVAWELLVGFVVILGKRSRDRLERRHARLMRNILESLADGVIVADTNGKILIANHAATAISGKGPGDVPPSAWSERYGLFVPGTERPFPPEQLPLMRAIHGDTTEDVEVFIRNPQVPDGTWVNVSGAPLLSGNGAVHGGVVVFRDISARKKAEERLQRLSSAVEQTADSVLITDRRGTIEYVNPAFEATTGYSSAEVLGQNPNILKSGEQSPEYYRELWATILRGEPFRGTTVNRKKNGQRYYAEQTITGIKDRDGRITHFVSVLKDMTERRKLQEREIEMQVASKVQRRLFPAAAPQVPGYDLAGAVFPADATCGDYFDFVPMPNGALGLVAADVSGHGLGPALVMAETRAYLRSLTQETDDLASILSAVNRFLVADLDDNFFVTMLLAKLEPGTGRLTYVNSAHPSGYIIDASGNVSAELASRCLPLGLFLERWRCMTNETVLRQGELAVFMTDGVLESQSPDGTEFGSERLLEVVREHRREPAQGIVERVYGAIRDFSLAEKQMDDVTIVICKRH